MPRAFFRSGFLLLTFALLCLAPGASAQVPALYGVSPTNQIVQFDPKDGKVLKSFKITTDKNREEGLAFDGTSLFYINGRGDDKVLRLDADLTKVVETLPTVFPLRMDGLAVNAKKLYVLDFLANTIHVVNLDTNAIEKTFALSFPAIGGISYGGSRNTLFVSSFSFSNSTDNIIYEINPDTGAVVHSFHTDFSVFGVAYSESLKTLFVSADFRTEAVNPDTGEMLYKFKSSYSALAADESAPPSGK